MEVILLENIPDLGERGQKVTVAQGYARNYLIPQKRAVEVTPGNIKRFGEAERVVSLRERKTRRDATRLAEELEKISVMVPVQAGEDDRLFGSVTSQNIADALSRHGVEIDRRKILLEEPIKILGVYTVPVKIFEDVEGKVKVWVVRE